MPSEEVMRDLITEEERQRIQVLAEKINEVLVGHQGNDIVFALTAMLCEAGFRYEVEKKRLVAHFANYADLFYQRALEDES